MRSFPLLFLATATIVIGSLACAAEPRVDLEVITEAGFIGTDAR